MSKMSQKFFEDINILSQITAVSKTLNDTVIHVNTLTQKLTYLTEQLTKDLTERVNIKERVSAIEERLARPPSRFERITKYMHICAAIGPIVAMFMVLHDFMNMVQLMKDYHHVLGSF